MPAIFCRDPRPSSWNAAVPASPHLDYTLREWQVLALASALPAYLKQHLVRRFLVKRPAAPSETPLALSSLTQRGYAPGDLSRLRNQRLCEEITIEAELIERTLNMPEEVVSDLSRNYLLAVHMTRLRQLWEEFCRRRWPGGWLHHFRRALGLASRLAA